MRCGCGYPTQVVDVREVHGERIRARKCGRCGGRFRTHEIRVEEVEQMRQHGAALARLKDAAAPLILAMKESPNG